MWRPLSAFEFIGESQTADRIWQDTFALGQDLVCGGAVLTPDAAEISFYAMSART